MPARRLFIAIGVFITETNLTYSHSPRMNTLPHSRYSNPRPPVQPTTKSVVLSWDRVCDSDGAGGVGPIAVVVTPKAFVEVISSRLVTALVTLRETSMRPTATPPNTYGRKFPVAQPARPLNVIASLICAAAAPVSVTPSVPVTPSRQTSPLRFTHLTAPLAPT